MADRDNQRLYEFLTSEATGDQQAQALRKHFPAAKLGDEIGRASCRERV